MGSFLSVDSKRGKDPLLTDAGYDPENALSPNTHISQYALQLRTTKHSFFESFQIKNKTDWLCNIYLYIHI